MSNNKTYAIVDIAELNNINYSEVDQTSADTVRTNVAEDKFILKWDGSTPASVAAIDPAPEEFTHVEILIEIEKPDWSPSEV